jgi:hypothetical protein
MASIIPETSRRLVFVMFVVRHGAWCLLLRYSLCGETVGWKIVAICITRLNVRGLVFVSSIAGRFGKSSYNFRPK